MPRTLREDLYGDAPSPGASDHKYSEDANRALDALVARVQSLVDEDDGPRPINNDGNILSDLKMFRKRGK